MQTQILIATVIVLGLSTIISANVFQGPLNPDPIEGDSTIASNSSNDTAVDPREPNTTTIASNFNDAESSCALCGSGSSLGKIQVLIGKDKDLYMFVDIPVLSNDTCCNVLANNTYDPTDIRGKRENAHN